MGVGGSAPKATSWDHVAPRGPPRGKAAAPGTKADCVCFPSVGSAQCPVSLGLSSLPGWHHQGSEVHPVSSNDTRQSLQAKTRPMMTVLTRTCLPGSSCDQTYSSHRLQNKKHSSHSTLGHKTRSSEDTGLRLRAPVPVLRLRSLVDM